MVKRAVKSKVKPKAAPRIDPKIKAIYRQEYESRDDATVTLDRILMWHKILANITGGLSLRISKRSLSRVDLHNWIVAMEGLLGEMKAAERVKS